MKKDYVPQPVDTDDVVLGKDLEEEIQSVAIRISILSFC